MSYCELNQVFQRKNDPDPAEKYTRGPYKLDYRPFRITNLVVEKSVEFSYYCHDEMPKWFYEKIHFFKLLDEII